MSSSITDVSSTRVETLRRDLRSSIHLNRKMNPYTGLWRQVSSCIILDGPHEWGCSARCQNFPFQTTGRTKIERKSRTTSPIFREATSPDTSPPSSTLLIAQHTLLI